MNIFRRSLSSASTSSTPPPPTSPQQPHRPNTPTPPLLTLPIELLRHISTYLTLPSTASLSLTSRYIYYALGTSPLSQHLSTSKSRFEQRHRIEAVVERAFPGHWFCAWCEAFHAWSAWDGPQSAVLRRACEVGNSYLDAGRGSGGWVLRYGHVRIAVSAARWGSEYGIGGEAFAHGYGGEWKVLGCCVETRLDVAARVVGGRFLLQSRYAVVVPRGLVRQKRLLGQLWKLMPHVLVGHRDSANGHTGLMAAVDNVLRRGWAYCDTQTCGMCRTDWSVRADDESSGKGGSVRLFIETWRDLGTGRNPFDTEWRAHGVGMHGVEEKVEVARLTGVQAGDVRKAFEDEGLEITDTVILKDVKRSRSLSPVRIYRSFVRRDADEEVRTDTRRSRARPRIRITRSENEKILSSGEDGRMGVSRHVVGELIRLDSERRRLPRTR